MPIWEETELLHQEERTLYCHQDALEIHPAEPGKEFRKEDTIQVSFAVNESICHMWSSLIYKLKDCWGLQSWKWCTFFHENLARLKIGRHTICQTTGKKLVASVILVEISLRKLLTFSDATSGLFPCKMTSMEQVQKFDTDDMLLSRFGSCFWLIVRGKSA